MKAETMPSADKPESDLIKLEDFFTDVKELTTENFEKWATGQDLEIKEGETLEAVHDSIKNMTLEGFEEFLNERGISTATESPMQSSIE